MAAAPATAFSKWHALGNAYLVIERSAERPLGAERVVALCDSERGVGAHGVVEIETRDDAQADVVIWNPDGSIAEMSGNGVRIAARWLAARGGADRVEITTAGRTIAANIHARGDVEQQMGAVEVGEPREYAVAGGRTVTGTAVSVGNPHVVVRLDAASKEDLRALGPALETHEAFPNRTNVQLVDLKDQHTLRVLVWERGAGETPSSGSSATAAAAVAVAYGWCSSPVMVEMPGGTLRVALDENRNATLTGPAVEICRGEVLL